MADGRGGLMHCAGGQLLEHDRSLLPAECLLRSGQAHRLHVHRTPRDDDHRLPAELHIDERIWDDDDQWRDDDDSWDDHDGGQRIDDDEQRDDDDRPGSERPRADRGDGAGRVGEGAWRL